jgi:hypothetical protein
MFLVPKVPLVDQQRKVMEENTALAVKGFTGAMGVDFWDRTAWQKEFNEADILVMTRKYSGPAALRLLTFFSPDISQRPETCTLEYDPG